MNKQTQQKNKICSVILPVYNSERYLNRTVNSVVQQTMSDFELLAIDDCSTDGSVQLLERWREKDSILQLLAIQKIKVWPLCVIEALQRRRESTLPFWTATIPGRVPS